MADNERKVTSSSDLGEFGLIDRLTNKIKIRNASTLKGIGDDAAVIDAKEKKVVVTTDLLTEGIHFNLMYVPLKHLGYKAVVVQRCGSHERHTHTNYGFYCCFVKIFG
jgi:thiamine-monophosphate kinase